MSILLRGKKSLSQLARAILKSFGSNASSYPFATRQGAYQTSAGPAATEANDPIGLELDALGTVGPELVTNGDFSGGTTGWAAYGSAAISAGSGRLQVTVSGTSSGAQQDITTVVGKTYRVVCDFVDVVGLTGVRLSAFTSGLGTVLLDPPLNDISTTPRTGFFVAISTTTTILLQGYATGSFSCDNVSCTQVTGNHATQPTAINRPTLQQDGGGRWYASFNGTNQSMQLASVPFQMADDFAVVACVNPGSPSGWGPIFAQAGFAATARIELFINNTDGTVGAYFRDDASSNTSLASSGDRRNTVCVVTLAKRGNSIYLRVNGVQASTGSTAALGAATFITANIGTIPFVGEWFVGGIYDLDPIKGTVTDAQLLVLEKAAAQKAGLVL